MAIHSTANLATGTALFGVEPYDDLSDAAFRRLSERVRRHCGINLHDGKRQLVRARISRHVRVGGFASADDYVDHVLADATGAAFTTLVDALSTNATSFFRERGHFDYLAREFMPELLARKRRAGSERVRAWSAACSSGEEAYSLAITLLESLAGWAVWDVKVLATDISTRMLRIAEAGQYDEDRTRGLPRAWRDKYFSAQRAEGRITFRAAPALRDLVRVRRLNLIGPWPFVGPFDFIFCRNAMIYFDKPTQQRLVNRFAQCLDPGGLLFTGHSESLAGIEHGFDYVRPTIYRKA